MKANEPVCEGVFCEIFKLHKMLDEAGIQHDFRDETPPINPIGAPTLFHAKYHIYYPSFEDWGRGPIKYACSVIEGFSTIGGEKNRLEIMGLLTNEEEKRGYCVVGYLTAKDVFERIKAAEETRQELFQHTASADEDYTVEELIFWQPETGKKTIPSDSTN